MGVQINGDTGNISATKADYSGNVTIGGTLTYEDVTNIDSVGLITARNGIEVGASPGVGASISVDGNAIFSGITTATTLRAPTGIVTSLEATTGDITTLRAPTGIVTTFVTNTAKVGAAVTITSDGIEATGVGVTCASINGGHIGRRNKVINGSFAIDVRNSGSSISFAHGTYVADMWRSNTDATRLNAQIVSANNPDGVYQSAKFTVNGSYSIGAGGYSNLYTTIEGLNVGDLNWGETSGLDCTLSFEVRSSITGTFGGAIRNTSAEGFYGYPFSYTISSADTWERKVITIPAPPSSSAWYTSNGNSIYLWFDFGTGSNYTAAAGSWTNANVVGANGTTKLVENNGATFQLAKVQFESGLQATTFETRKHSEEHLDCSRYYYRLGGGNYGDYTIQTGYLYNAGNAIAFGVWLPVPMRSTPTIAMGGGGQFVARKEGSTVNANSPAIGGYDTYSNWIACGIGVISDMGNNGAPVTLTQTNNAYIDFHCSI